MQLKHFLFTYEFEHKLRRIESEKFVHEAHSANESVAIFSGN